VRCSANFDKTSHLSRDAEVAATFSGYEYKSGVAFSVNARAADLAGEICFRIRKMQSRNVLIRMQTARLPIEEDIKRRAFKCSVGGTRGTYAFARTRASGESEKVGEEKL